MFLAGFSGYSLFFLWLKGMEFCGKGANLVKVLQKALFSPYWYNKNQCRNTCAAAYELTQKKG